MMSVRRLAWALLGVCVALAAGALAFLVLNDGARHANSVGSPVLDAAFGILFLDLPGGGRRDCRAPARQRDRVAVPRRRPGRGAGGLSARLRAVHAGRGAGRTARRRGRRGGRRRDLVAVPRERIADAVRPVPDRPPADAALGPAGVGDRHRRRRLRARDRRQPRAALLLPGVREPAGDRGARRRAPGAARRGEPDPVPLVRARRRRASGCASAARPASSGGS